MMTRTALAFLLLAVTASHAGPLIPAGDIALRHDIQVLADHGVIKGPTTTWPLAWGPVLEDIRKFETSSGTPTVVLGAIARLRDRGAWETRTNELTLRASISIAEKPTRIRSYSSGPREESEVSAGASWTGDRFSVELNGQALHEPSDFEEFRADGSQIAVAAGNWTISANTLDRWWGPGWDGSLILSNNARSIPALSLERNFPDPYESRLLRWLGPWDLAVHFGQMESDRGVPEARFFGFRFDFRPLPSLQIGLSRTAQWCGAGRPCDAGTFWDLLLGRDNADEETMDRSREPGNQLAGLDFRWAFSAFDTPLAVYGQFTGEDEAGGFPSRYLGLMGIDGSGALGATWSYRWYAEAAATSCDFGKSEVLYNCAYNHGIYTTGYRYRGRAIGHGADNDARIATFGVVLVGLDGQAWQGLVRAGTLNRAGPPDSAHSLAPTPQDIWSVDLMHSRPFRFGTLELGLGYEHVDDAASSRSDSAGRAFINWRSSY